MCKLFLSFMPQSDECSKDNTSHQRYICSDPYCLLTDSNINQFYRSVFLQGYLLHLVPKPRWKSFYHLVVFASTHQIFIDSGCSIVPSKSGIMFSRDWPNCLLVLRCDPIASSLKLCAIGSDQSDNKQPSQYTLIDNQSFKVTACPKQSAAATSTHYKRQPRYCPKQ